MNFNKTQIDKIVEIAFAAGEIAKDFFLNKNFEIKIKADKSKVTTADLAVSKFIAENLSKEFPQIPVICEEGNLRDEKLELFWLIDPIDGTSGFVRGEDEFAVNIALIKDKKAIFGLIYAPIWQNSKKMLFVNEDGGVSAIIDGEKSLIQKQNDSTKRNRIVTSKRTNTHDLELFLSQKQINIADCEIVKLSSAVKFFKILQQESDLYFHPRATMEWDTAAGQALVESLGGVVKKLYFPENKIIIGEDLIYQKPNFSNPPFVCYL